MPTDELNTFTKNLYARAQPGDQTQEVVLENGEEPYDAEAVSAALAVRYAALHYTPILEQDATTDTLRAKVKFQADMRGPDFRQSETIPAKLVFTSDESVSPLDFQAHLVLGGTEEFNDLQVRYTRDLRLTTEDVAALLEDVYRIGSVHEDSFTEQDELKSAMREFEQRVLHIALTITKGPDQGFKEALLTHMSKFDPHAVGYPENTVQVTLEDHHGKFTGVFEPAQAPPAQAS